MKIIKLKKLPRWQYTSPLGVYTEAEAIVWAAGRGADTLYYFAPTEQWIVRINEEATRSTKV